VRRVGGECGNEKRLEMKREEEEGRGRGRGRWMGWEGDGRGVVGKERGENEMIRG